ncbi:hypothetical protein L7F22_034324 [Adiantum nelumboides]|nr:hypothetical protein [Adiantum nelumboides]
MNLGDFGIVEDNDAVKAAAVEKAAALAKGLPPTRKERPLPQGEALSCSPTLPPTRPGTHHEQLQQKLRHWQDEALSCSPTLPPTRPGTHHERERETTGSLSAMERHLHGGLL